MAKIDNLDTLDGAATTSDTAKTQETAKTSPSRGAVARVSNRSAWPGIARWAWRNP
ncbi:MAG: hypothetical protein ACYCQL_02885 [Acidithiobacillus sp.]